MLVRDLNPSAKLIVEVLLRENAKTIRRKKIADYIIVDGEIVGSLISRLIMDEKSSLVLDFLLEEADFIEEEVSEELTLLEAIKKFGRGIPIGVRRGEEVIMFPDPDFEVLPGDRLIFLVKRS